MFFKKLNIRRKLILNPSADAGCGLISALIPMLAG